MINSVKRFCILTAAIGAVSLAAASTTMAQYRVNTGGVDANNRIGSGGANQGGEGSVGRGNFAGVSNT